MRWHVEIADPRGVRQFQSVPDWRACLRSALMAIRFAVRGASA
jgi:hypothetical protein